MRRLALLLSFAPFTLLAWSADGHRQVADIAWTKLTPAVLAKLGKILAAGEPTFTPMSNDVRESFRQASTWSDFIKGTKPSVYDDMIKANNTRFEPNIESTPGNEGVRCKTWHYYDVPIRYRGAEPAVRPSNALVALTFPSTKPPVSINSPTPASESNPSGCIGSTTSWVTSTSRSTAPVTTSTMRLETMAETSS